MKRFLLSLAIVLVTSFLVTGIMTASAQFTPSQHCTASHPCIPICGDHVCAPGELNQMKAKSAQAAMNNATNSTTPSTPTVSTPTTGVIVAGVVSYMDIASDGTAVIVRTGHPLSGQPLAIGIAFKDSSENFVQHQNYAITVTQDNHVVLSNPTGHTHTGTDTLTTLALSSNNPIDITVTLNGVGLPTTDPSTWTGVKGEVLNFSKVLDVQTPPTTPITNMTNATSASTENAPVPEFGPIASLVLVVAIVSVIAVTAKTRRFL